jgi:hypothetical protein
MTTNNQGEASKDQEGGKGPATEYLSRHRDSILSKASVSAISAALDKPDIGYDLDIL